MNQMRWNLSLILPRVGWLIGAGMWYFLAGFLSARQLIQASIGLALPPPHLGDGLFVTLAGPPFGNDNLLLLLNWLASTIFFLMLVGDFANRQCAQQDYLIVLRVGSRRFWWLGVVTTIVLVALGYIGVILGGTSAGVATQLSWDIKPSAFFAEQGIWQAVATLSLLELIAILFSMFFSSLVVAGLVQVVVALYTHRAIWGFLVVLIIALGAWLTGLGNIIPSWQQWLPGTQSIVSRHWPFEPRLPDFTLLMSLIYNAVLIFTFSLVGLLYIRTFDFFGGQGDE